MYCRFKQNFVVMLCYVHVFWVKKKHIIRIFVHCLLLNKWNFILHMFYKITTTAGSRVDGSDWFENICYTVHMLLHMFELNCAPVTWKREHTTDRGNMLS